MKILLLTITLLLFTGCINQKLNYTPVLTNFSVAVEKSERLIHTQHTDYKPDKFVITNVYLEFGYQPGRGKNASGRYYYDEIKEVKLLSWIRKAHQWYVVTLIMEDGTKKHIYRTKKLSDAELVTDSIATIMNHYQN